MSSRGDDTAGSRGAFRQVNEQIAELRAAFERDGQVPFVCECGRRECTQLIDLTLDEYEAVRASARRFAIALDHENPAVEAIDLSNDRFAVVETFVGEASRIAEDTDPRKHLPTPLPPQKYEQSAQTSRSTELRQRLRAGAADDAQTDERGEAQSSE